MDDCKPILDALESEAANEMRGLPTDRSGTASYYREVARRIVAGYTKPNYWTEDLRPATEAELLPR